ncbi:hypothetical protein QYF61_010794 [Mycteria americana]|uniref:T4S1 protein n=1 Tax=Mycteria americana TaxID=33587 RepID=A0AAN7NPT7_MYCAM|nr:hypothetical protein QYF61_010794 [Mycteria americana]
MCVGKCSRIVGPCLLALGTVSVAANILLLFPGGASKYLAEGHISKHAKVMPGVWGGGITVLLAATHITAVGWRCAGCSDCGTRCNVRQLQDPCAKAVPSGSWWDVAGCHLSHGPAVGHGMDTPLLWPHTMFWSPPDFRSLLTTVPACCPQAFISAVLSKLALLGAAACFVLSGVGLTNGPLCFYNASEHGRGHGTLWGYPFLDAGGQEPDARAENYLHDRRTWSICLEPAGVVAWNVVLFSLLLLVSATEMVLASLQILNGCLGCLCGFCEGK